MDVLSNWTISFDAGFDIVKIWNATIISHVGTHYVIGPADWNATVAPEGAVSFGFEAASTAPAPSVSNIAYATPVTPPAPPEVTISDAALAEGLSGTKELVFTVTLSKASAEAVTIPWSTQDGTAHAGSDFQAASGSVTFAPGETSRTISVTLIGDTLIEADESFGLVLGTPVGASLLDGTAQGMILNDDVLPSLSIGAAEVTEGNSGTRQMVFTVTLSAAATGPVTVGYATQNGTATAGGDYTAATGTLSFAAGETSKTVSVTVKGDTANEGDEAFSLALSGAAGATIGTAIAQGTILNDDAPPVLSISNAEIVEGASGTRNMVFTVSLSKPFAQSVSARFATADGTATAGSDYVAKTGTISFAAGETSKTIAVAVKGDKVVEADESFGLILSSPTRATIAAGGGTGTIRNDDLPPPTLSVSDAQVSEGNSGSPSMLFTVSLSRAATGTVSVTYATQAGTATAGSDYVTKTGTLSFAAGETSKTIAVAIKGDTAIEADESFNLKLGTATGATIQDGTGVGTIRNDDLPPPGFTVSDAQVTEGDGGSQQMLFTVSLSRAATGAVSVNYATQAGTATAGGDFTAASGTLSFAAGETSKTIAVAITGDTDVEADETLSLLLSAPGGGTILDGTGVGTILNNDVLPTLSISDAQITEGNAGSSQMLFTVSLSRAMSGAVSVTYATQAGTAAAGGDFTATSGTLSFAAGETSKTIAVAITGDTAVEANESFGLLLSAPSNATLLDSTGTGSIVNDDVAAPPPASGDTVSYRVASSWNGGFIGEMTVVNDATALQGWTVEFDAPFAIKSFWNAELVSHTGDHYVVRNVAWNGNVAPLGSTSFGFDVDGAGTPTNLAVNGGAPAPAIPALSLSDASLTEGDAGTKLASFTVRLSSASAEAVTVNYATADGTALAGQDYQSASGSLTFAAGETSRTIAITVLGDTLDEANEAFSLHLTAPAGATLLDATGQGSIRDDDGAAGTLPPEGYYSTSGNQIIDSTGANVRLHGVNWFGIESDRGAPDGLFVREWHDMMEQMVEVGFDTIRLPFSVQTVQPGAMPKDINYYANPDLLGLSNLQIMDKVVDYAGELGVKIILDAHRATAGAGPNENGLWYDQNYSEAAWIDTWQALAGRYDGNSTVIGMDLQNEPFGASWTDWSAAAERAGNAIHEVNPNLLIIVEGVANYGSSSYWWGGELSGVRDDPVTLDVANKLVYSSHDYPVTVYPQPWFQDPDFKENLPNVFREHWGFIFEEGIAPVLVGEFGTMLQDPRDAAWLDELTQYLNGDFNTDGTIDLAAGQEGISFTYWSWNPNSYGTGGILMDDWTTPHENKLAALENILI